MKKILGLIISSVLVLSTFVAGCGSGTNSGSSSSSSASQEVIKIGAAVSMTGPTAKEGKLTKDGYDFWKDWVNSHGGIKMGDKTYKVEMKYYDDESKAETSAKLMDKLINEDKIKLILGPYGSGPTFAALAVTNRNGALMINTQGAAKKIYDQGSKLLIGALPLAGDYFNGFIKMAQGLQPAPKTAVILYANDSFSTEVAEGAKASLDKAGINVLMYQAFPQNAKDLTSLLTQVKQKNPDLLLGSGHLEESIIVTRQMKELNLNVKAAAFTVGPPTPDFPKALGKDAEYVFGASLWTPDLNFKDPLWTDTKGFVTEFKNKFGYVPDYHVAEAVSGCEVMQQGIQAAASTDPVKVREAIGKMTTINTLYGAFHFNEKGIVQGIDPAAIQIIGGTQVTVYPQGKPQYPVPAWDQR